MERTLAIIKPDAVANGVSGKILDRIAEEGFRVVAMRQTHLTRAQAEGFYAVHSERPFFGELTEFMSSGPCVPIVLERDRAIKHWRDTMGATNPDDAAAGTLRKLFATDIGRNACHGSDAPDTAAFETGYFFAGVELIG